MRQTHPAVLFLGLALASPAPASDPLSAIEWLERRPEQIVEPLTPQVQEEPVTDGITTPQVTVAPLGAPQKGAAGLLPTSVTGLPKSLWSGSETQTLSQLLATLNVESYPALQSLLYTLLLAEAAPPYDAENAAFLKARTQTLLTLGAIDPAQSLLAQADPAHVDLFDLYFDVSLLSGNTDTACASLQRSPQLTRDLAARIYCDARSAQWDKAALTLSTADAIGALDPLDVSLLERFLDPELFENDPVPAAPSRPTPLQFRLLEATGDALRTASLPRAFAYTDLGGDSGWKAQAEAAERLIRVGAISENRLDGIFTSRIPSASGGVWERIEAMQRFDVALRSGDPLAIQKRLIHAYKEFAQADLATAFAALYAEKLLPIPLKDEGRDLATRLALLSANFEQAAARPTGDPLLQAAQAVAKGTAPASGLSPVADAIAQAFTQGQSAPDQLMTLAREDRLGEAILRAMSLAIAGAKGDPAALTNALAFFRSAGLATTARRFAIHTLLQKIDARP